MYLFAKTLSKFDVLKNPSRLIYSFLSFLASILLNMKAGQGSSFLV
jgi:hypothetical protein